ncbi:MAG: aminotransferase class V-fold PLP-dependent enzyme, partial [Actinomycetota bacterium]
MTYLDHAATTPMRPEAVEAMEPFLTERVGNPSGGHALARAARQAVEEAREVVAGCLGCRPPEVVFTGGGTEADNLAVAGVVARSGGTAVCSAVEHHAVLHATEAVGGRSVAVRTDGRIDLDALADALDAATPVVSVILLAVSDNGPQMTSGSTREFMALCAIACHFGRPGTPSDQAWIESLFGHVKTEHPHLLSITDPEVLRAELAVIRAHYNGVRLHAGIGYVCPDDEHEGRGQAIRKAREAGLEEARLRRLTYHREQRRAAPPRRP